MIHTLSFKLLLKCFCCIHIYCLSHASIPTDFPLPCRPDAANNSPGVRTPRMFTGSPAFMSKWSDASSFAYGPRSNRLNAMQTRRPCPWCCIGHPAGRGWSFSALLIFHALCDV